MKQLIALRQSTSAFSGQQMELFDTGNQHALGFSRVHQGHRVTVVGNFSESTISIEGNRIRTAGMGRFFKDLRTGEEITTVESISLTPYQLRWLERI